LVQQKKKKKKKFLKSNYINGDIYHNNKKITIN